MSLAATDQVHLSSSIETVCPGETVEFTCTVYNGISLQWDIPTYRSITFLPSYSAGRVVNREGVLANLTWVERDDLAANMTSTLTYQIWDNTEVVCEGEPLSVNVSGKWCVCTAISAATVVVYMSV